MNHRDAEAQRREDKSQKKTCKRLQKTSTGSLPVLCRLSSLCLCASVVLILLNDPKPKLREPADVSLRCHRDRFRPGRESAVAKACRSGLDRGPGREGA